MAVMAVVLAACSSTLAEQTTTTTSPYVHPKSYAWSRAHSQDVRAVISESQIIQSGMLPSVCGPAGAPCPPGEPPSLDPRYWTGNLPQDCANMTADVSTAQSDGQIPSKRAQGWWAQSLSDFDQACTWIARSEAAEQAGQIRATSDASYAAISALRAAVQGLNLVRSYATAGRCVGSTGCTARAPGS
jgi:hypothetical protein